MMSNIRIILSLLLIPFLLSCGSKEQLPTQMYLNDAGYNQLKEQIISHYPTLAEEIEVISFDYGGSYNDMAMEKWSSTISMEFVKGTNKDRLVSYTLSNDGSITNANIDVSVGEYGEEKLSNKYETFEPELFSSKLIQFDSITDLVESCIEEYKKDTGVESAMCNEISINKEGEEPIINIRIHEKKLIGSIRRDYTFSMDGKKIE